MSGAPLVVITDSDLGSDGVEERLLAEAGLRVRRAAGVTADDVRAAAVDATAAIVQWAPVTAEVLDALPALRFISRLGIGYDMIDVEAAAARGVAVANTPAYCVEEVASHTLALILSFARGIVAYDRAVHAGTWAPIESYPAACRPSDATVAVIGMGRIGARVAAMASACGFRVVAHDPFVPADRIAASGARPTTLDEALTTGDIVTLHLPLTAETRHLVDGRALASMRATSVLVNTCRGELVDEDALADALRDGVIAGAGLDVFRREPLPDSSALRSLPNVLLTPHAAWYSPTALRELPRLATQQVIDFLAGRPVPSIVNRVDPGRDGDGARAAVPSTS